MITLSYFSYSSLELSSVLVFGNKCDLQRVYNTLYLYIWFLIKRFPVDLFLRLKMINYNYKKVIFILIRGYEVLGYILKKEKEKKDFFCIPLI